MGNPHQPWAPVSTYYEAHMIVPGKLNFYGSTFIGRPDPDQRLERVPRLVAHGQRSGPGRDLRAGRSIRERPDHYRFDGGSVPMERDDVDVGIKGKGEPPVETRTFWHTPLGPVIHRTADKVLRAAQRVLRELSGLRAVAADDADQELCRVSPRRSR